MPAHTPQLAGHPGKQVTKQTGSMIASLSAWPHLCPFARGHRHDGPPFAGQAQRGTHDPADSPALGTGGTGSPADTGALTEPPRSRGQFQRGRPGQRGAIQAAQGLARMDSGRRDALPDRKPAVTAVCFD